MSAGGGGGGEDFSTGAELSLSIPDAELSGLRTQIERELSDIAIGVDASVSGGGRRLQPRDPSTGQFREIRGVEQRIIEQTEAQVELLDDISDTLDEGGVFGGGGGGGGAAGGGLIARLGLAGGSFGTGAIAGSIGTGAATTAGIALGIPALASLGAGSAVRELTGAEVSGGPAPSSRQVELTNLPEPWPPELQLPEGFPPTLNLPSEDFPPQLQVPDDFPPQLQVPDLPDFGGDGDTGPPSGPRGRNTFRQTDPGIAPPDGFRAGAGGRNRFRRSDPSLARDNFNPGPEPNFGERVEVRADVSEDSTFTVDFASDPQQIIDDVIAEVEPEIQDAQDRIDNLRRELENAVGL